MKTDYLTSSFMALREQLHRNALCFLKNEEDARDALQDTFSRLWNKKRVESDAEARNKLFTVLRNVCIDRLRRPRIFLIQESELTEAETQPTAGEDIERLESLITEGLTPLQRRVCTLVAHEGMEYEEIARILDTSVEAVRMNMSRARKKIRDNYKKINR